ncbi:hypothetical protein GCK32_002795 [Trichostrongylus colubriformis]|uniref:SSD domain-containing protein n=1 Tax=Trichostrongylus colubriformis TaxID=6319 RepID=A0AAN8FYH5_TRICO
MSVRVTLADEERKGGWLTKLRDLLRFVTDIRSHYYRTGCLIGSYPRSTLFCAMLLSFTTYGMKRIELKDSIRQGYTALEARSRYETQALREFLNTSVDPMEMVLLLLAKDGGSIHRKAHLDEAASIVDFIYNMSVISKNRPLTYNKMCAPYCFADELFRTFKRFYDINYQSATLFGTWSDAYNVSYPFASIWGFRVPLEQCLFGVVRKWSECSIFPCTTGKVKRLFNFGNDVRVDHTKPLESQITNMGYVKLIVLFPYGFKNTRQLDADFSLWELGVHDWTQKYNKGLIRNDSKIEVLPTNSLFCRLICVCATLCPLLGITSTYGILALIGIRVNSLLLVMPFLVMGVGVDALFLMMFSWQRMSESNYTPSGRLGK